MSTTNGEKGLIALRDGSAGIEFFLIVTGCRTGDFG
jgi:hypothetical protein